MVRLATDNVCRIARPAIVILYEIELQRALVRIESELIRCDISICSGSIGHEHVLELVLIHLTNRAQTDQFVNLKGGAFLVDHPAKHSVQHTESGHCPRLKVASCQQ